MKNRFIYIIILLNFPLSLISQNEISITNSDKKIILNKISELIKEQYVFPKKTERISQELLLRLKQGNYDTLNNYENFSNAIGRELRTISKDNHFNLAYFPNGLLSKRQLNSTLKNRNAFYNYGVSKLGVLEGNIGYFKLDYFALRNKKAYKAAFSYLSNVNGLILDLRDNNGGDKTMVGLLASYFLEGKVLLATIDYPSGKKEKIYTSRLIKKGRMNSIPMVILTSNDTFSAAEFFSYSLKHLGRATIIGRTSGGGAHPNKVYTVNDKMLLYVPIARVVNPITKTNWENTGVIPNEQSDYKTALTDGHLFILRKLQNTTSLESEKDFYQLKIDAISEGLID